MELHEADCVVVKPGKKDPDMGFDIGGWQGRVEEVYQDEGTVLIRWDSITLFGMGDELIIQPEIENLDWELMVLDISDLKKTVCRDSVSDTNNAAKILQGKIIDDPRLAD